MRTTIVLLGALLLSGALSREAAAGPAYLKVTGQRQGNIRGGVTIKGREDTMEVIQFSHEIVSPRDAASGLPTGKRQHKPLTVIMTLDKATPLLYSALTTNENLQVELRFYQLDRTGVERNHFTIKLTNASLSQVATVLPDAMDPANLRRTETVQLSFTYQKIEWTWTDGGITASDDWETPIQ